MTPSPAAPAKGDGGVGRDRWRGGGVYVDGEPVGVLRYGELPAGLEPIWETQRHRLPFKAGEPITYRETKAPRFRITDYLRAVGVRLDDVVQVHLHGGRASAIVLTGADLRRHPDELLFKFAQETSGKPIPIIRTIDAGTTFDDLQAMTIYIKRTPPTLTADESLELDGHPVLGIPYYGEPMREGVRIYLDNRLVTVLKRNQMPATSHGTHWSLDQVVASHGVDTRTLAQLQLIHDDARTATLAWTDLDLAFNAAASGEVVLGQSLPANAIALFTGAHRQPRPR